MKNFIKNLKWDERFNLLTLIIVLLFALINIIQYTLVLNLALFITMLIVNILFILIGISAYQSKISLLYVVIGIFEIVLHTLTNFSTFTFSYAYLIGAILTLIGAVTQTIFMIINKEKPIKKGFVSFCLFLCLLGGSFGYIMGSTTANRNRQVVQLEKWAVPSFIEKECVELGVVESISYKTKAYATDCREVIKKANVYLPYGYDETKKYNILYLVHGTGDNEDYWLKKFSYNKVMLDNMIHLGVIDPLIVVTPTFYTENDCSKDLDKLTYSFKDELRNDLMPYVEEKYSTYAESTSKEDFILSRNHRAFAGLSRGAVTMYHAALCGSLDYFSSFGAFSGTRTNGEELKNAIQTEEFKSYSINCYYVVGGTLDFALPLEVKDFNEHLKVEPRFTSENTYFSETIAKRHAISNWHLNLYNYLQVMF